jgi:hypothetical protein
MACGQGLTLNSTKFQCKWMHASLAGMLATCLRVLYTSIRAIDLAEISNESTMDRYRTATNMLVCMISIPRMCSPTTPT